MKSLELTALIKLLQYMKEKHHIIDRNIIGHADVAPGRKTDPWRVFPWGQLAEAGIGMWLMPEEVGCQKSQSNQPSIEKSLKTLGYGYTDEKLEDVVSVFKAHFDSLITGLGEDILVIAAALAKKYAVAE